MPKSSAEVHVISLRSDGPCSAPYRQVEVNRQICVVGRQDALQIRSSEKVHCSTRQQSPVLGFLASGTRRS